MLKKTWLSRPGTASAFTPALGKVQQCKTSVAEIKVRISFEIGNTTRWSTSSNRNSPNFLLEII